VNHTVIAWQVCWLSTCHCSVLNDAALCSVSPFDSPASVLSGCHSVRSGHLLSSAILDTPLLGNCFLIVLMDTSVHCIFEISGVGVTWGE
jgi:hypothetical protein